MLSSVRPSPLSLSTRASVSNNVTSVPLARSSENLLAYCHSSPQNNRHSVFSALFCTPSYVNYYTRSILLNYAYTVAIKVKGKGFPYSTPSVGPGADPGVQAVSLQVTVSHTPGGRLPLLSARPAVTSPAAEHHRPLAGTKLYCLVTEAHRCKQLA